MAPRNHIYSGMGLTPDDGTTEDVTETDSVQTAELLVDKQPAEEEVRTIIVWRNVFIMAMLHIAAVYAFFALTWKCMAYTLLWAIWLYLCSGIGITAGAHRLWAHRTYKAKLPLRILLGMFNSIALQNDIYEWSRDHRVHHKYSETEADPHNATRGFFFAHVGWLLCRKHPKVIEKGSRIDLRDLLDDPVVKYQRKFYLPLILFFCFILPTAVPVICWGESIWNAFYVAGLLRYCFTLNCTWMVNSAAHMWGNKPYDRFINPSENIMVSAFAGGEGWHNYHHTFPWDYKTSEFGWKINLTTMFIDLMATLGQVTERKTVPEKTILARMQRTGSLGAGVGCD
ncbi:acyl-CoA desaturase-like [Asterias amurensis]|uniref:acyl-CoA desaturase-like n=1 Tax=Asterias amurensis TaxID=7602 RepID=UPI003AB581DE